MIPITRLNAAPSTERIQRVLVHLHEDIRSNAQAHLATPDLPPESVDACIAAYRRQLQWISDIFADEQRRVHTAAQLARVGWDEADVTTVHRALSAAVEAFATSRDFAALLSEVQPLDADPETVWPE